MAKEEIMEMTKVNIGGITLVNATPHTLNIVQSDGTILELGASGICPRCSSSEIVDQAIGLIQVTRQTLGHVQGLPDPIPGTYFIVSRLVASATNRDDLLVPGSLIRDDQGKVVGCKGLSRL